MKENQPGERYSLPPEREELFAMAEKELAYSAEIYKLGERFEGLRPELANIVMLDVTKIPGCHYGAKNVFVPIIHHLEKTRNPENSTLVVSPETAILVESSTGNGWVAFSDAAEKLSYKHVVIMPDGLPEARYKHPQGRKVEIIRTPKEDYAQGMPKKLAELMGQNRQRFKDEKKIYVSPNHAISNARITIKTMSDIGRQLIEKIGNPDVSLTVIISMGNGASLCSIGEYVKRHCEDATVVATEDFAYGAGYDRFRKAQGWPGYSDFYAISPETPQLMKKFTTYGTNAPIGIKMPLQERAFSGDLIDHYELFTDSKVLKAYSNLSGEICDETFLPNRDSLPKALLETYGNSTLGNIAVAREHTEFEDDLIVAMAYDSRKNY